MGEYGGFTGINHECLNIPVDPFGHLKCGIDLDDAIDVHNEGDGQLCQP